MATNFHRCEVCKNVHSTDEREETGDCPKCGSEDVFPYRLFECGDCKKTGDQEHFFNVKVRAVAYERNVPKLCNHCQPGSELALEECENIVEAEQMDADPDPIEEKWVGICEDCHSRNIIQTK